MCGAMVSSVGVETNTPLRESHGLKLAESHHDCTYLYINSSVERCRVRKKKCDGATPCFQCERAQAVDQCVYAEPKKRG